MFRIHNRRLFWRLAGRSIKANLGRNLLTALAVFLSTLMLFSIFTIGVNYFRNLQVMMDRLDGVTDALLYAPTQEQYEQIKATPGVEVVGIRISPGSETIPGARGFEIPLQHWYYDEVAWEYQILPMISDVVGTYPQDTLRIMMSTGTLKRLGIENPEVGMTIHLTQDYQLTGWFTDYKSEDRVLRSESGMREIYSEFWGWDSCQLGVCWSEEGTWEALQQIPLTDAQYWVSTSQRSVVSLEQVLGLLGFTALLILVGSCLFVSNILSLSVQHDIRFYGMLKTLGTTPQQLRTLVRAKAILGSPGRSVTRYVGGDAALPGGGTSGSGDIDQRQYVRHAPDGGLLPCHLFGYHSVCVADGGSEQLETGSAGGKNLPHAGPVLHRAAGRTPWESGAADRAALHGPAQRVPAEKAGPLGLCLPHPGGGAHSGGKQRVPPGHAGV